MTLSDNQKQMIADMLLRTEKKEDIEINADKIWGNAYGSQETVDTYKDLAKGKVAMLERRKK